jgi:ketosteroid isomerase-like protein
MRSNEETYRLFTSAWGSKDLDALMELVTDDIVYGASVGPEPGTTFVGREQVRAGFAQMLRHDDVTNIDILDIVFAGHRAYAEWRFALGSGGQAHGVDALSFRDGKISMKQGFRKVKV